MLPVLGSLKALLGVEVYGKHFADPNDEPGIRSASAAELADYLRTLLSNHLCNKASYQDKAQSHVHGLLGDFTKPSSPLPNVGFFS